MQTGPKSGAPHALPAHPAELPAALTTVPNHTPVEGVAAATDDAARAASLAKELASRDQFIAALGHELRNAVSPLILLAEQFTLFGEEAGVTPALSKRIPMLDRNLRKFVATIERVTQVAHLRAGKLELVPVELDLVEIARAVAERLRTEASVNGSTVVIDADEPVVGRWDRDRVDQIVHHLLSNAIRYAGGGMIEIRIRGDAERANLSVRDHGPGLPGDATTVFDQFEHTSSRHGGGLGVGLFVIRRSCALLGGSVSVENVDDGGAHFSVMLPRG